MEEERFFQNTNYHFTDRQKLKSLIIRSSHGTARSYSVSTFAVKNHSKLLKAFQRELTVRTIQRLTLENWYTNLQQKPLRPRPHKSVFKR